MTSGYSQPTVIQEVIHVPEPILEELLDDVAIEDSLGTDLVEQLLSIGAALSSAQELGELLNLILTKSREITWSDAGSVFIIDNSGETPCLWFKAAQNDSLPHQTFHEFSIPITPNSLVGYVALTGETLNIPDAYNLPADVPYQLNRSFDESISYRTRSVLVLPMQSQEGEIIGVLQLINRKLCPATITPDNATTVTQPYSDQEQRILQSLASQAAISIERNHLLESIENLFEGFVKASVQVIEARDPTTSGHSERVAELSVRLITEVNRIDAGPLRSLYYSDRQIKEIRYASLLHDFGKVGVPEAILNKQKKLFPFQIDILRQRFALAKRTLEMNCAQTKFAYLLEHPQHRHHQTEAGCHHCQHFDRLERELVEALQQLDEYWLLVEQTNEPTILPEEPIAKLQQLSRYTYTDYDGQLKPLLTEDELTQLLVNRGNLTPLERVVIESHVTHTYEFLKRIPWTKHLQGVPLIAYGHHERLNGSGYPRQLTEAEIPLQAQMIAVADVYDALTASDRPYKKSLPVDAAINILRKEADGHKLNSELVMLFEQRQVFSVLGHVTP